MGGHDGLVDNEGEIGNETTRSGSRDASHIDWEMGTKRHSRV